MGILPVALFASGHTYFVQRLHEHMGLDVYAVHATFQYSGTPGKRHRMRERLLWLAVRTIKPAQRPLHYANASWMSDLSQRSLESKLLWLEFPVGMVAGGSRSLH